MGENGKLLRVNTSSLFAHLCPGRLKNIACPLSFAWAYVGVRPSVCVNMLVLLIDFAWYLTCIVRLCEHNCESVFSCAFDFDLWIPFCLEDDVNPKKNQKATLEMFLTGFGLH